jgi:hypothetical protein
VSTVIKAFFPGQRLALVYSDPKRESSGNLIAAAASPAANIGVFNNLEAAEAWLGLEAG